jgi:two-component system, LytTR family, sensor kinase
LVHEKPDLAEEMTLKLSNLFRKTTKRDNATFYSLAEEMEIVKTYLEIEQIRFGTKLKYETHVNNDCLNAQVPKFIIQPLVENAIKHGTSKITENGFINVTAKCFANKLQISVHDNGPHFNITESAGYGLTSIQEKIKLIYGKNGELSIQNSPEKLITISIPYE